MVFAVDSRLFMNRVRASAIVFFLVPTTLFAQQYKPFSRAWKWAATAEAGGVGPGFSVNLDYSPVQFKRSFVVLHGGIGYLGTHYCAITLPHSLTWAILLNNKVKGCPPRVPPKSTFLEIGLGGSYLVDTRVKVDYVAGPIVGVRRYFQYNQRATGFWKVQISPMLADVIVPWGGVGVGIILD